MSTNEKDLSAEKYISKHRIDFYFEDAVKQMLVCKEDNIKVDARTFLHQYFRSLKDGTQTLYREFRYVFATPLNRASFIRTFWSSFQKFKTEGSLLHAKDYFSLLCLLCPDFKYEIVEKTVRMILVDDAIDSVISFADFMCAFQFQFYYHEFVEKCRNIFYMCFHGELVSSSAYQQTPSLQEEPLDAEVNSAAVLKIMRAEVYCKHLNHCVVSEEVVCRLLQNNSCMTFYGFLKRLSGDHAVGREIGAIDENLVRESNFTNA